MKKALVITVGTGIGQNEEATRSIAHGIVASIKNSHPDSIVFVVTKESKEKTIPEIKRQMPDLQPYEMVNIKDMNDVNEVFEKLSSKVRDLRKEGYEVVVDFTSGTKAMSAGAVLAATSEGTTISYIAGERVEGRVPIGSEQILTNFPLKGMIETQKKIMKELFNTYQFEAVLKLLDELEEMTAEPSIKRELDEKREIAEGYYFWDRFEHEKAKEMLSEIDSIPAQNKEFLGRLLNSEMREAFYIADLLNNAKRRKEEGKYDDAVARLYRTMELVAQYILKEKYGIATSNLELEKIPEELRDKYGAYRTEEGKIKLGLYRSYEFLNDLGEEVGEKFYMNSRIQDALSKRNLSILAHGLEPVSRDTFDVLYQCVREYAEFAVEDLEALMEKGMFPRWQDCSSG